MERWLPIVGYEGLYEVSDYGRIRSLDRLIVCKDRRRKIYKSKIMGCPISNSTGYRSVTLSNGNEGKRKERWVHIIVCETFHGPKPTDKHEVGHRDDNKLNNVYTNLRWVTRTENMTDQRVNGRLALGSRHWNSILTEESVHIIRKMRARGVIVTEIARTFNVSWRTIKDIVEGKTWRHLIG